MLNKKFKHVESWITKYLLLVLIFIFNCISSHSSEVTITKIYTIYQGNKGHCTTRGTIDLVHRYQGTWFVFHAVSEPSNTVNGFQTSQDGIHWSNVKTGINATTNDLGRTYAIEGNKITMMNHYTVDQRPEVYNMETTICEGTISGDDIIWNQPVIVIPADSSGNIGPTYRAYVWYYYNDLKRDASGRLHFTGRYINAYTGEKHIYWMRALNSNDITAWEKPLKWVPGNHTSTSGDAHENIQLLGNEVYVIARTNSNIYVPGTPGKFYGNHFDGTNWETSPTEIGISDGISGSDRRLSAIFDRKAQKIHFVYIDNDLNLYYRTLSKPFKSSQWTAPVLIARNTFTCTMGIDTLVTPSRLALVYGNQLAHDGGRWHTGELYLKWFDGQNWESTSELISEPGIIYNWFPNMIRDVSGEIGVIYLKGYWGNILNDKGMDIMFSLIKTYYTILGKVDDGINPLSGVTITFNHDGHIDTTDVNGSYSYDVVYNTTTTITPNKPGYTWSPSSISLSNIKSNQSNMNFTGTINTYTISGKVDDGKNPLSGVTIIFSHDGHMDTTDVNGNYSYDVPYNTTTTITPNKPDYTWSPASISLSNINCNQLNLDFTGTIESTVLHPGLLTFTVDSGDGKIRLYWTASHSNIDWFEVERSLDGEKFCRIGVVPSNKFDNSSNRYSYIDRKILFNTYYYRLKIIDYNGHFNYSNAIQIIIHPPKGFDLYQNYPNPFNSETKIKYLIPQNGWVSLQIYNMNGELIRTLIEENQIKGQHTTKWDGYNDNGEVISGGVYFYRLKTFNFKKTKKMILIQ